MLLHKSLLAALTLAVIMAFAAPIDAQAQVTEPEESQETEEQSVTDLVMALNNLDDELQSLEMHQDLAAEDIHVVNVDELVQESDIEGAEGALDETIEEHQTQIDDMRQRLTEHQTLQNMLMQQEVNVEDVVAVEVKDDREEVVVYYQPQGPDMEQDDY